MSSILVLDLDDTLYPELTYVKSGLAAVAEWLEDRFGWSATVSKRAMLATLAAEGRGAIFDRLLQTHGRHSRTLVEACVRVYRHHMPLVELYPAAVRLLERNTRPLYLVTDGHKVAQYQKIRALGIEPLFRKVFITHRYGVANAKPSLHCFNLIRVREGVDWADIVYVGDNPSKDFVGLNKVGSKTVRVLTGGHRDVIAQPGFEAQYRIDSLDVLDEVLRK